ncbi:hypothetical protein ACFVYJ_02330 [Pontibacter sp. JAM-7]|uniref:hypothetical protein n=1 Tax=Pontibacter sp. JAM-7 TaxID=3366581 RepID=UPI003AF90E8E
MARDRSLKQIKTRYLLLMVVAVVLLAGLLLSTVYLHLSSQRLARVDTLQLGQSLASQTAIMSRPLLLANDRISINYLANQIIQLDYVTGLELKNPDLMVVARAGNATDLKLEAPLGGERPLGTLTLWLNPAPTLSLIRQPLIQAAFLACTIIFITLFSLWYSLRHRETADVRTKATPEPPDFAAFLQQQTAEELPLTNNSEPVTGIDAELEIPPEAPQPEAVADPEPVATDRDAPEDDTQELVALLKPARNAINHMPRFEHHPHDLPEFNNNSETHFELQEQEVATHPVAATEAATKRENPLMKHLQQRQEVQLNLYPFEHELELMLAAENACYIVYIDTVTHGSDNTEPELRQQLLQVYQQLALQVAGIYQGEAEKLTSGDVIIRFNNAQQSDEHGINAVCSAMLFTLLYRLYNQSRIRQFQPVLNLQTALARGHHNKQSLLLEEARFLTRTIQSNALISHTALTEAPKLKQALLQDADIRREDEDKVIMHKLQPRHQDLLQKQANHLISKFFNALMQTESTTKQTPD